MKIFKDEKTGKFGVRSGDKIVAEAKYEEIHQINENFLNAQIGKTMGEDGEYTINNAVISEKGEIYAFASDECHTYFENLLSEHDNDMGQTTFGIVQKPNSVYSYEQILDIGLKDAIALVKIDDMQKDYGDHFGFERACYCKKAIMLDIYGNTASLNGYTYLQGLDDVLLRDYIKACHELSDGQKDITKNDILSKNEAILCRAKHTINKSAFEHGNISKMQYEMNKASIGLNGKINKVVSKFTADKPFCNDKSCELEK